MATAKIPGMRKGEEGGKNQFEPLIQLCHGAKALSHLRDISAKSFALKFLTQKKSLFTTHTEECTLLYEEYYNIECLC